MNSEVEQNIDQKTELKDKNRKFVSAKCTLSAHPCQYLFRYDCSMYTQINENREFHLSFNTSSAQILDTNSDAVILYIICHLKIKRLNFLVEQRSALENKVSWPLSCRPCRE